jgi:hypothetical protein
MGISRNQPAKLKPVKARKKSSSKCEKKDVIDNSEKRKNKD